MRHKAAEYGAAALHIQELVLDVLPNLICTGYPKEVIKVDHVLHGHRDKTAGLHAAGVGNAVSTAKRNHEAMVIATQGMPLSAFDVGDDIFRGGLGRKVRCLYYLGKCLIVMGEPRVITDDIHERIGRRPHLFVYQEAIALSRG
jgi:hypothetical protein